MGQEQDKLYLTTSEAARIFGVSELTVRTWLRQGKLRGRKIDTRWLIPKAEVMPQTK